MADLTPARLIIVELSKTDVISMGGITESFEVSQNDFRMFLKKSISVSES